MNLNKKRGAGLFFFPLQTGAPRDNRLDFWRGFCLVHMIVYHFLYDLAVLYRKPIPFSALWPYQLLICSGFILISGFSFPLSRHPLRAFVRLALAAGALSLVTACFIPSETIRFGILHFMALAHLLLWLSDRALSRLPARPLMWISALIFLVLRIFISTPAFYHAKVLAPLFARNLFWLGFPGPHFSSADYFPLIPWFFLFISGYAAAGWLKIKKEPPSTRFLCRVGRHTLVIYLVHQIVIYAMLRLLLGPIP